jgi:hypothetical protein
LLQFAKYIKEVPEILLLEFYNSAPTDYQDLDQDNSAAKFTQTRSTRLTLAAINKIRRMNEVKAFERAKSLKKIRKQYSPPAAPSM